MRSRRISAPKVDQKNTAAIALGLVLAASICTASAAEDGVDSGPTVNGSEVIGEMVIDGRSHALTRSHWCEPEAGFESGTTVAIRVAAYDETGDVMVYARQMEADDSGASTTVIMVATDPATDFTSEGFSRTPTIEVENSVVHLAGDVRRPGNTDPIPVEASFSLGGEPGFPGQC